MSTPNATRDELERRWDDLRGLDASEGSLELIVVRPSVGERTTPESSQISLEEGLVGDRWRASARTQRRRDPRSPQPADAHVHRRARPDRRTGALAALGDNLLVDMGLDQESLPAGSRLAIGDEVVVEISEEPHTGCAKFSACFGSDALKFIDSPEGRVLRLRGANARVVVPGTISAGAAIRRL